MTAGLKNLNKIPKNGQENKRNSQLKKKKKHSSLSVGMINKLTIFRFKL